MIGGTFCFSNLFDFLVVVVLIVHFWWFCSFVVGILVLDCCHYAVRIYGEYKKEVNSVLDQNEAYRSSASGDFIGETRVICVIAVVLKSSSAVEFPLDKAFDLFVGVPPSTNV